MHLTDQNKSGWIHGTSKVTVLGQGHIHLAKVIDICPLQQYTYKFKKPIIIIIIKLIILIIIINSIHFYHMDVKWHNSMLGAW